MARKSSHRDPAQEITDYFIARLSEGKRPWVKPWTAVSSPYPLRITGQAYRGMNCFWLDLMGTAAGYSSPYWMTYKQAADIGAQVRKGKSAQIALFYKEGKTQPKEEGTFIPVSETDDGSRTYRMLKHYFVFNADQIDGLDDKFHPSRQQLPPLPECERREEIDRYFSHIPAKIQIGGNVACYQPASDDILMPPEEAFKNYEYRAATLAHEIGHWTGAKHRLNRTFGTAFGDEKYSAEELVAEIHSHFVARRLGLPTFVHDNNVAYVQSWLKILKNDKTAILSAASKAQQAFDYIESFQPQSADMPSFETA